MPEALKTILIVDDNHDAADTLAALVRDYGHKVLVAYDTASGLALAHQSVPDIILHDIGLPIINGYKRHGNYAATRNSPRQSSLRLLDTMQRLIVRARKWLALICTFQSQSILKS